MRTLHSVGNTRARPGETVQDVIDRREWGESGPFYGRIEYLVRKLNDPMFIAGWAKGDQTEEMLAAGAPERFKFLVAAQTVLNLTFETIRAGNLEKAHKQIDLFQTRLKVPFTLDAEGTSIRLPIPGSEGIEWKVGPNTSQKKCSGEIPQTS